MLSRSFLLSCSLALGTTCLAPHAVLLGDEHSESAKPQKKHAVTIHLDVDGNDVSWESHGDEESAHVEKVVDVVAKVLVDSEASHPIQKQKRVVVIRAGDDDHLRTAGEAHSETIQKVIELVHGASADHDDSDAHEKKQMRVMVFVEGEGDDPREYQTIVLGDDEDIEWHERVEHHPGNVWIHKRHLVHRDDEPSYRLGIMLGEPAGVVIHGTMNDSPAAEAGLQAGDLLLAVDGQHVSDPSMLIARVAEAGAEEKPLRLLIVRDDFSEVKTVDVRPEAVQHEESGEEEHADEHDRDHEHDHARALNELREELGELRDKIKKLQRALRDDD